MTFYDPYRTVPEAARLLRIGGLFAFMATTSISLLCQSMQTDQLEQTLVNDYFGMTRFEWDNEVDFQLPYGEWIRLFRRSGFIVEDLIETQPAVGATSDIAMQQKSHGQDVFLWRTFGNYEKRDNTTLG